MRAHFVAVLGLCVGLPLTGCSGDDTGSNGLVQGNGTSKGTGGAPSGSGATGAGPIVVVTGSGGDAPGASTGGSSSGGTTSGTFELPADFTAADTGGFKLGTPVTDTSTPPDSGVCNNQLTGIVRDFKGGPPDGHPDFERPLGQVSRATTGIVQDLLGSDRKPVYAPAGKTTYSTTAANFDEWYRTLADQPDQNLPFYLTLFLVPDANGTYVFQSEKFFPIDGQGYGNQNRDHNFHFTFELHTTFTYKGGEVFTFKGDDDVFVFVNNHLAVDLGGVHNALTGTTTLDTDAQKLGIVKGGEYPLDMFHAERHTVESHFRVETTIDFTNCGQFVPDMPPPR